MVPDYIIATDGSARPNPAGGYFTGYAFVIMNYHSAQFMTHSGPLGDSPIAYAEAWALYQAIRQLNVVVDNTYEEDREKYRKRGVNLLAITDSKLLVDTFNAWIPYAWDTSDYYHWKKADGSEVKNQDVFRYTIKAMERHRINMRIVHINSHVHDKALRNHIIAKMKRNMVRMDNWTADELIRMNQRADDLAQEVTAKLIDRNLDTLRLSSDAKNRRWKAT